MAEWPKSRQLAAMYQSPGNTGIGFARYASSGTVTPELWLNIEHAESLAESNKGKKVVEHWAEDMAHLRDLLREEGITNEAAELAHALVETVRRHGVFGVEEPLFIGARGPLLTIQTAGKTYRMTLEEDTDDQS